MHTINLEVLKRSPDHEVILQLIMGFNDLQAVSYLYAPSLPYGVKLYLCRLENAHLFELLNGPLNTLNSSRDSSLWKLIDKSEECRSSYAEIAKCLPSGKKNPIFEYFAQFRHNVGSHYSGSNEGKMIKNALIQLISEKNGEVAVPLYSQDFNFQSRHRYFLTDDVQTVMWRSKIAKLPKRESYSESPEATALLQQTFAFRKAVENFIVELSALYFAEHQMVAVQTDL